MIDKVNPELLRLNLGCGGDLRKGWVNVDQYGDCDVKLDLNTNWPWADGSVQEVAMCHVLEHLPDTVQIMKELYRVCCNGAEIYIRVPHPRHDDYLSDPTHVRPITTKLLWLFSKKQCEIWTRNKASNTPLATIHNVNFEVIRECYVIDDAWMDKVKSGKVSNDEVHAAIKLYNNVAREIDVTLKVIK